MYRFLKTWMLPLGMIAGASAYLIYMALTPLHRFGPVLLAAVKFIQPMLIFLMLLITFCLIEPRQIRPHRWQGWLLGVQGAAFLIFALLMTIAHSEVWQAVFEGAMLCMICPTATAASVATRKLGGDVAGIITYTILINVLVAVLVPLVVPLVHPVEGVSFGVAFRMILSEVFPLLICPCLMAWLIRYLMPRLHRRIVNHGELAFYLWAVAMPLAILMTVRSIVHSDAPLGVLAALGGSSLAACAFQFWTGKVLGSVYDRMKCAEAEAKSGSVPKETPEGGVGRITAGQALGQKNTVFAIWMGYTFLSPVVSIAGGFYSIWHNIFNSWQLARVSRDRG